jgi:uncharacterized membrane protein (UPF0136 family)
MQVQPTSNPLTGIILIVAICGAIADRHYKKMGGDRPDKSEKWGLAIAITVSVALLIMFAIRVRPDNLPRALGEWMGQLTCWVFAGWEAWRWQIRRHNPIFPNHVE